MMVSGPAIIMSIVRLSLMSMVVSVRNLGWHPATAAPRVGSFSLSTCVASRAVCSLNTGRSDLIRQGGGIHWNVKLCKNLTTNLNYEIYKIYKQAMQVYIIFMHADLEKFAISRILHAPTQNDESFPTIWCWNIWTKIVNILTTTTLHPPQSPEWMPTFIWHPNMDTERTFRDRNSPELLRAWKPILTSI